MDFGGICLVSCFVLAVSYIVLTAITRSSMPIHKGSFKVSMYKNGELLEMKTVVNDTITIGPGDKFDQIIIEEK